MSGMYKQLRVAVPRFRTLYSLRQCYLPCSASVTPTVLPWQIRGKKTVSDSTHNNEVLTPVELILVPEVVGNKELEALIEEAAPKKTRKRRTKLTLSDDEAGLPQGLLPLDPIPAEDDGSRYPSVLAQHLSNMRKFENCVVLTRVGGFYELYFDQADELGPLLNLKVGKKHPGSKSTWEPVSATGFPFFQLDRYLKVLVQDLNHYVAIAEEFPNDPSAKVKSGGLMHNRRVSRIVTPGTLIDENFMDPFSNNYVLAVHAEDSSEQKISQTDLAMMIGLAWLDLSTGHFFTQSTTLAALTSFLARIGPKEVILSEDLQEEKGHGIFAVLEEEHYLVSYIDTKVLKPIKEWTPALESAIPPGLIDKFSTEEVAAGSSLLHYVGTRLQGSNVKVQPPIRQCDVMGIDKNTMRALEIKSTMREDSVSGSLLNVIRRTVTKGGARLLGSWLTSPSTSLDVINSRLDIVTHMLNNELLLDRVKVLLKRSHDSHRLLQKFAFGRGDADDLLALASTVFAAQDLVMTLIQDSTKQDCVRAMVNRIQLDGPSILAARIKEAIDEEGIEHQHDIEEFEADEMKALTASILTSSNTTAKTKKKKPTGLREAYNDDSDAWIMKPSASSLLVTLHQELFDLHIQKEPLTRDLQTRLGVPTLTLRFTPGLGHICHVKGSRELRHAEIKSVSSSKSTRSFHHPEWTSLGQQLDRLKMHIRAEETRVFNALRAEVILNIIKLRRNAAVLDELDVACSFASLAREKSWTRPLLNTSTTHKVIGGRHPTVEGGLAGDGRRFITNDCFVGEPQRIWLITGPNMAGKSTFLRQNALITILAQVGSYVPAEFAEMGVIDQLFSRVGSADNLFRDQSTFMVEMLETARILRQATARSFVIMDEVGRGTTPNDGAAVAFACLEHLYRVNKSRTLFATHFHELSDRVVEEGMGAVGFWCTDVEENESGFRYLHRLRQGVNRESHALKVARLAGLPEEAIAIARRVLDQQKSDREM
ncbi:muts domain V [Calycina marina]|uniref:Muts domain V n=1 Tax=Calycina marina TaxID=1763456 RepID=A0A9P7Z734_9HELO|nr:muts domain V [Calycina marina]